MRTDRRRTKGLIGILGALAAFGPMSIDMYLPSLPTIVADFATTTSQVQLSLSAFLLGLAAAQFVHGSLSDRFGRKPPLICGIALYVAASMGCAAATNAEALILFRLLQGIGGAAGPVLARAIVRDLYDKDEGARVISLLFLVMGGAPLLAPLVGGQVLVLFGWRAVFWILAGFGLVCLALVTLGLRESLTADRRTSHNAVEMVAAYGKLFANPRFVGYALCGGCIFAGMFAYISGSPFVFIEVFGVPPEAYGLLFGLNVTALLLGAYLNSRVVTRLGVDPMLLYCATWAAVMSCGLALVATLDQGGLVAILVPLFLYMLTVGMIGANATAGGLAEFPKLAGSAAAMMGALQYAIGAVFGAAVGALHDDSALPMAGVIAVAGVAALLARVVLVGRPPTAAAAA